MSLRANDLQRSRRRRITAVIGLAGALVAWAACRDGSPPESSRSRLDLLSRRPTAIELETRRISFGDGDRSALLGGWGEDEWNPELEVHYVWASASEARVALRLLDVRAQQFLVRLAAFPTVEPQRITVLVNDEPVGEITPGPTFLEHRFEAPERVLHEGENVLTFRHSAVGPEPRTLAAAYDWLLLGPECARLRPRGRPPHPPRVRARQGRLRVRGPAELAYRLHLPESAELRLRVKARSEPVRVRVRVTENGSTTEAASDEISPPLFGGFTERAIPLSRWGGRTIELRLGVLPSDCRSPFAKLVVARAEIVVPTERSDARGH